MTVEDLSKLAKTYEEAILSNELTKSEVVMLVALIDTRVKSKLTAQIPNKAEPKLEKVEVLDKTPAPLKSTGVSYDPMFDPEPPMKPEVPPPIPDPSGELLLQKNFVCTCYACNRAAYIINDDVHNGEPVEKFINALVPTNGVTQFDKKTQIDSSNDQLKVDCPLCKGRKTLYLKGRKDAETSGAI